MTAQMSNTIINECTEVDFSDLHLYAVITGDITQVDLPRGVRSGLRHSIEVLKEVKDISFNFFTANDVVRHPVVGRIVVAYEEYDSKQEKERLEKKGQLEAQANKNEGLIK